MAALNVFQVYNFETKNLLNEVELLHDVVFWKWVNEETIILVTENSVHQWAVFRGRLLPRFIFCYVISISIMLITYQIKAMSAKCMCFFITV